MEQPLPDWRDRPLAELLAEHGLAGIAEVDFPTDGWSGATFTVLDRGDRRFIIKRTSHAQDWIARATLEPLEYSGDALVFVNSEGRLRRL